MPGQLADAVARLLVAASQEPDPERAFEYSLQARKLAARVGVVRETAGVAAYRAGRWAEALAELRTARRLTGRVSYLPLMADSERALGRLDRALAIVHDPGVADRDRATQIELLIVESGIRRDQGRPAAGAAVLQVPELTKGRRGPGRLACSTPTRTRSLTTAGKTRRGSGSGAPPPWTPTRPPTPVSATRTWTAS